MFDKNEYFKEIELFNNNASQKRRQQIQELLHAISSYKPNQIDKKIVDKIILESKQNIGELFESKLDKTELYEQLIHSFEVCIDYWDDGYFDNSKKHFKKFIRIKLDIKK